jgi:hypothetical protein
MILLDLGVDKEPLGFVEATMLYERVDKSGDGAREPEGVSIKTRCLESVTSVCLGLN